MYMLFLWSFYASMTFNCHMMLNIDDFEKIPLLWVHLLLSFAVYRDAYLDTNPKIAIYRDTVFRGDTHPYSLPLSNSRSLSLPYVSSILLHCLALNLHLGSNLWWFTSLGLVFNAPEAIEIGENFKWLHISICSFTYGHRCENTSLRGFANNKGADQPAHPCRLISTFVIPLLKSIISKLASSEISIV